VGGLSNLSVLRMVGGGSVDVTGNKSIGEWETVSDEWGLGR